MFLDICVLAAAAILAATLVLTFRNRYAVSRRITILLAGICISSFFLFLPRYWEQSFGGVDGGMSYPPVLRSIAYTLHYGLKVIRGGQEIKVMEDLALDNAHPAIQLLYYLLNYGFFIAAPLLTSGLLLSLIGDWAEQLRCRIYLARSCHVFSELNPNTLQLAERIRKTHPRDLLVFCGTKEANKEQIGRARALGAALLYASCTDAKLRTKKKYIQFYLVSGNEDINLCHAEELICKYRHNEKGRFVINAFAESGTGIQMVENMDRGTIGIRFVDATALFCSDLLLQHPLYLLPPDSDTVSVVLVGCDKVGLRMLKTIAWSGTLEGCRLKIRVYDKNAALLEKKLAAQCPELASHCDVAFVAVDAQTADLEKQILDPVAGSPDATYIVMAMGDDELNIAVAERLFRLFRHHNRYTWMPQILARIRNAAKSDVYRERENPYLLQRRIHPFGGVEDIFTEGVLHQSYLENLAFAVDLCYGGLLPEKDPASMTRQELREYFARETIRSARDRFLQSEYRRRSSMAAALHIPVKLHSCGILPDRENTPSPDTALRFRETLAENPALLETLAKCEHLRWNQFMRSEGYVRATWEDLLCFYPTLEKKNNQDALSKRHLCLVEWEDLDEANRKYLQLDPPEKKNFKKSDFDLIRGIPDILLLAKRMEELSPADLG